MKQIKKIFVACLNFLITLTCIVFSQTARADQILVLSGGGSPEENHYSQYLEAKTLTDGLRSMLQTADVNVLFGFGNSVGQPSVIADVRRTVRDPGIDHDREVMIPGPIVSNRAATRENVDDFFRKGPFAAMKKKETFFLLVGGHGGPNKSQVESDSKNSTEKELYDNNGIQLWITKYEGPPGKQSITTDVSEGLNLSKKDLIKYIIENGEAGKTVFSMSQCYSGDFHRMFLGAGSRGYATLRKDVRGCGFTSTTENQVASGCVSNVEGPEYQGYGRLFTEQLTGMSVVTGSRLRPAKLSFKDAHQAATLEDLTLDIPLSTSDYFLMQWAIATNFSNFEPPPQSSNSQIDTAGIREIINNNFIGKRALKSRAYLEKESFFLQMQNNVVQLYPDTDEIFTRTTDWHRYRSQQLEKDLAAKKDWLRTYSRILAGDTAELMRLWAIAVKSGKVSTLSPFDKKFEVAMFGVEDQQKSDPVSGLSLYFMSTLAIPNPDLAENLSRYRANRMSFALTWAETSGDKEMVSLAHRIRNIQKDESSLRSSYKAAENKNGLVLRILRYRQVLGAWVALDAMREKEGLATIDFLLDCESTRLH